MTKMGCQQQTPFTNHRLDTQFEVMTPDLIARLVNDLSVFWLDQSFAWLSAVLSSYSTWFPTSAVRRPAINGSELVLLHVIYFYHSCDRKLNFAGEQTDRHLFLLRTRLNNCWVDLYSVNLKSVCAERNIK